MNEALFGLHAMDACCADVLAMKRPVLIVFDLDGTLTDSAELARVVFKHVFAQLGYGEISDALADSFNGPSAEEVCRIMGVEDRALYDTLVDDVEVDLVYSIGKAYPGALETLAALAPLAHLTILTNGAPAYCAACVDRYGFAPYVAKAQGFAAGVTKAQRIAMWEREFAARRVIVVGDRATDIQNARAANAYAIGVTFGMGGREEVAGADVLCDTLQQVTQACMRVIDEI